MYTNRISGLRALRAAISRGRFTSFTALGLVGALAVALPLLLLATTSSAAPATISLGHGNPFALAGFVNSKVPGAVPEALHFHSGTAHQVCKLAGYNQVISMSKVSPQYENRTGFVSPHNNLLTFATRNGQWITRNAAELGNTWISGLRCGNPISGKTPTDAPTHSPTAVPSTAPDRFECKDGKDNDGDGFIDREDPDCWGKNGKYDATNKERTKQSHNQCIDLKDNDGDGKKDQNDIDCRNEKGEFVAGYRENTRQGGTPTPTTAPSASPTPTVTPTSAPTPSHTPDKFTCRDKVDRDGDGFVWRADPDCWGFDGKFKPFNIEYRYNQQNSCIDGIDNDKDGKRDQNDSDCRDKHGRFIAWAVEPTAHPTPTHQPSPTPTATPTPTPTSTPTPVPGDGNDNENNNENNNGNNNDNTNVNDTDVDVDVDVSSSNENNNENNNVNNNVVENRNSNVNDVNFDVNIDLGAVGGATSNKNINNNNSDVNIRNIDLDSGSTWVKTGNVKMYLEDDDHDWDWHKNNDKWYRVKGDQDHRYYKHAYYPTSVHKHSVYDEDDDYAGVTGQPVPVTAKAGAGEVGALASLGGISLAAARRLLLI